MVIAERVNILGTVRAARIRSLRMRGERSWDASACFNPGSPKSCPRAAPQPIRMNQEFPRIFALAILEFAALPGRTARSLMRTPMISVDAASTLFPVIRASKKRACHRPILSKKTTRSGKSKYPRRFVSMSSKWMASMISMLSMRPL